MQQLPGSVHERAYRRSPLDAVPVLRRPLISVLKAPRKGRTHQGSTHPTAQDRRSAGRRQRHRALRSPKQARENFPENTPPLFHVASKPNRNGADKRKDADHGQKQTDIHHNHQRLRGRARMDRPRAREARQIDPHHEHGHLLAKALDDDPHRLAVVEAGHPRWRQRLQQPVSRQTRKLGALR